MAMFSRDQLYTDGNVAKTKALFVNFGKDPSNILDLDSGERGYPCLKTLYVNLTVEDPSESTFVNEVFGDYYVWHKIRETNWMKDRLELWQHEAAVKRKSLAFSYIVKEIKNDGRNGYQAAKFLIDEPWKPKTKASTEAKRKSTAEAVPAHIVDLTKHIKESKGKS